MLILMTIFEGNTNFDKSNNIWADFKILFFILKLTQKI